MLTRLGSQGILFRSESQQSIKSGEPRAPGPPAAASSPRFSRALSRVNWSALFRVVKTKDPNVVLRVFQKKIRFTTDTRVAIIEFLIIALSAAQLELSSQSRRWHENRECLQHAGCRPLHDEGSFSLVNLVRVVMAILGIVRAWMRFAFLKRHRWRDDMGSHCHMRRVVVTELFYLIVFPFPGVESLLPRHSIDTLVLLSIAVGVRSICWRQLLYFPYPIRQQEKVTSFTGNLEFSYRQFVVKKVLDDTPIRKILLFSGAIISLATILVRASESVHRNCVWTGGTLLSAEQLMCRRLEWEESIWMVVTPLLGFWHGGNNLRSRMSRLVLAVSSCMCRGLLAMLTSVIIKKMQFSTKEARAHAFLVRLELFNKKDLSAVMAVQASFRFNKTYKRSLTWHKHEGSQLYYRPLSARLPNEVKKKLYAARFQTNLKDIMRFQTDGDPLNAFTKHIEVITAALGVTFVEVTQLKRIYYRQTRILEERKKLAQQAASSRHPDSAPQQTRDAMKSTAAPLSTSAECHHAGTGLHQRTASSAVWGAELLRQTEDLLAKIQALHAQTRRRPYIAHSIGETSRGNGS
ncbi:hypothetical protein ATCC90586_010248 [Pythium insidiosum]|nr:hypothetical protein ATCC90586_010248 [Pythium insidiosum]